MRGYGWRARIGHIYPAVVAETFMTEFFKIVPDGVTLAQSNLIIESLNQKDGLEKSIAKIDQCAEWLAKRNVDIITIGGSPMFRLMGVGSDRILIDRLEKKFNIPVTTNQTAVVEAFRKLGVTKIAVASPYFPHQDAQVKQFLEASGFEVVNIKGLSTEIEMIHTLPLETSYWHAKKVFLETPSAEAVYIPCAHFAVPYLQELEEDIQVPVITSLAALLWYCFDLLKVHVSIKDRGRILSLLAK